ncbi:MAG: CbtA family protein [Rhodospirillales bacterium]|nr:CbtA family protein [Rhodospirillales bacterium]
MYARIVLTALAGGLVAGVFLWGAHMTLTSPLIAAAEVFETGVAHPESSDAFRRHGLALLMDVLAGIGFAFLLTGAISLSGQDVDWRRGMLWGLCGFAAFYVAPSLGLPPKLPGMQTAALDARQAWWLATAAATAVGLGLALLSTSPVLKALGVVLIVLPQGIGAPAMTSSSSPGGVPAELAAQFVITTTVATGLFWMVLGGLSGYFYNRFDRSRDAA